VTTVTVVVAAASAVLFFHLSSRERQSLVDAKVRATSMVASLLAASLSAPLDFEDTDATKAELENAVRNPEVLWAGVLAPDGRPLGHAGDAAKAPSLPIDRGTKITERQVVVASAVRSRAGKDVGTAVLVMSLAAENDAFEASRGSILRLCFLLALGTATLLVLVTRSQIVAPLQKLSEAARQLEKGQPGVQVEITSRDEVGSLARAFNAMSSAVVDREAHLAEARRGAQELLDHMRQAIVVFDASHRVIGVPSGEAFALFGRGSLEGASVVDLLYPASESWSVERRAFEEWLEVASTASPEVFDALVELAPREVVLPSDEAGEPDRVLEVDFRRLHGGDHRVMLLALDVTERRRLELAADEQSREMAALRRVVGGVHVFVGFLDGAHQRIERSRALLSREAMEPGASHEVFRHVHTLRGEAHVFELSEVTSAASDLETHLVRLREDGGDDARRASLEGLARVDDALGRARARLTAMSGEEGNALERVPVDRAVVAELVKLAGTREDAVGRAVRALAARPFGEMVTTLAERVPTWAESLGKNARLEVQGRETGVPPALARVLGGALIHLVRNAVAHGIEPAEVRRSVGKAEQGVVSIRCESNGSGGPRIVVEDDGAGLGAGIDGEKIFEPGFSTADGADELAGHGVGLFAVRQELAQAGYDVAVTRGPAGGARFELRPSRAGADTKEAS
jgi:two-component system chemotaxis sensor kinase CheA